jgi:hypothetical protein
MLLSNMKAGITQKERALYQLQTKLKLDENPKEEKAESKN